jgi:hypothetical protein
VRAERITARPARFKLPRAGCAAVQAGIAWALIPSFRPIQPKLPIRPRHQVPAPPLRAHTAS